MTARWLLLVALLCWSGQAAAAPPLEDLLPRATRQFVSVPDAARLRDAWRKTGYAALLARDDVKPTVDRTVRDGVDGLGLGVSVTDLRAAAGGPAGWAVLPSDANGRVRLFALDTTGKKAAGERLLASVAARLKKLGYTPASRVVAGVPVEVWTGPAGESRALALHDGLLIACDRVAALEDVIQRWKNRGADGLAGHPPFRDVWERGRAGAKEPFDLLLYFDPLLLAWESRRAAKPAPARDRVKIAKAEGFDAFKAVGGGVRFAAGPFEVTYRFAVHAPPPYRRAMRMINLRPGKDYTPPDWVPTRARLVGTLYGDVGQAFRHVGSLVDAALVPGLRGAFAMILQNLKEDTEGPRVDVEKEIIAPLGRRLTVLSVATSAGGPGELVLAMEARDTAGPAAALRKLFDSDREIKRHTMAAGVVLWETPLSVGRKKTPGAKPLKLCLCAARGHLFASSDREALELVLRTTNGGARDDADYKRVVAELDKVAPKDAALRWFTRPDFDLGTAYESVRRGEADASSSLYAYALSQLLAPTAAVPGRDKLPPFDKIQPSLGPSGLWVSNSETGWLVGGFSLKPRP